MAKALTALEVARLRPGEWRSDGTPGGGGKLVARGLAGGAAMFYFRHTRSDGSRDTLPIGVFDRSGLRGLSLDAARARAAELRLRASEPGGVRAALAREARAAEGAQARTLGALLNAYCDQLDADGRASARSVRAELYHHVRDAHPGLWAASLSDVDADDLLAIVARPVAAGHKRQGEKIRAYLRAAYAAGVRARHHAGSLAVLRDLRVATNPARDLVTIHGANKARDRALSLPELRAYWRRIRGAEHALLRFHLLTGGQRVQQLGRATTADYDAGARSLRLFDAKGRRTAPRVHYVPVLPAARAAMRQMQGGSLGPHLVTVTGGASGVTHHTLGNRIEAICTAMLDAGELRDGRFTASDLRRTVETRLAEAGVAEAVRARLQSHGLGGVQARHYDRADYLPQTRRALMILHRLMIGRNVKGWA